MSTKSNAKKIIQNIALMLFLIGLPLVSWYYLRAGFNYHKELMSELKDYGRIPEFSLINHKGDTIHRDAIEGKTAIVSFFNPSNESYTRSMEYFRKYFSQFKSRHDLLYVAIALEPISTANLKKIATKESLNEIPHIFLTGSDEAIKKLISEGFQIPDIANRDADNTIPRNGTLLNVPDEYPYFVLVNESGMIRNYYDLQDDQSMTRLIEHLAITLPRKSEEEAVLKREKEK